MMITSSVVRRRRGNILTLTLDYSAEFGFLLGALLLLKFQSLTLKKHTKKHEPIIYKNYAAGA